MTGDKLQQKLKENPNFEGVPSGQVDWLIQNSVLKKFRPGEFIFRKGEPADQMIIVIEGRIRLYIDQNGNKRELGFFVANDISGLLPFSRLQYALGYAEVLESSLVLLTHRDKMKKLVAENYELAQHLVHHMTSRVREFTSSQQMDEKMAALGKLSAGLAHELNNPASAIVRSSDTLLDHLKGTPEGLKKVISLGVTIEQIDKVNEYLFAKLSNYGMRTLKLKDRLLKEEEILDWLEDHDLENSDEITESFLDFGIEVDELEDLLEILKDDQLNVVFNWMNNVMITEKTVQDIHKASCRISDLVNSVKSYSHMDRGNEKSHFNIHDGINDTLNLLSHKIRSHKIKVIKDFADVLPKIKAHAGELNQVWTNVLDNAVDALETVENPMIEIKTSQDREFINIDITDNGPGIPDEVVHKIFDPFFTTKEVGKGSGMGLDIVRKIINHHNGSLKVHSEPGKTMFKICLPIE